MKKFNLEDRLIDFAVLIIEIVNGIKKNKAGNHISNQLIRCGTSASLNYGEAQAAESRKDFIHKMKIILKELRETYVCLKIIKRADLYADKPKLEYALKENDELISIIFKSISTAQKNLREKKAFNN